MATVPKEEEKQPKQDPEKITIQRDRSGLYGLHISNITAEINESDLRSLFETSGFVKLCKIIKTFDNDRVAFVKFDDHEEAVKAMKKLNHTKLSGSSIVVRPAYESQKPRNRYHRERTSSSESLPKSSQKDRKGHWNTSIPTRSERTIPKDEKIVGEQKHENNVFYASQDVRHVNSSEMTSVPTSSPGKNGDENQPPLKSNGSTSTQVNSTTATGSGKSYIQTPWGSKVSDVATSNDTSQLYSQGPNTAQRFPVAQGSYTMTKNNPSPVFSSGRPSPSTGCSYQNSLRAEATSMNSTQNGYNNYSGVNNTHMGNQYMTYNGTPSSQFSPASEVSKAMGDLSISNPGFAYSPADISKWSVEDVVKYFNTKEESTKSMVNFLEEQEIDGNALMLLEQESLLHFMKLGPALKLLNLRDKLKQ